MAPRDPGFDLGGYRDFLRKKFAVLQLSAMHASTYDRRIALWSVFVSQSARESVPVRDVPRELLRQLREEGHQVTERDEEQLNVLREQYRGSPITPVFDILTRDRLVVVLGDPGSGKTCLLRYLVLEWAAENRGPVPIWIDLKEYALERMGFLKYVESGCTAYGFRFTGSREALGV